MVGDKIRPSMSDEMLPSVFSEAFEENQLAAPIAKYAIDPVSNKPVIEVDDEEKQADSRIVYWAAFDGQLHTVKNGIEELRMSPFIDCFQKRTIITAAVMGQQLQILEYILSFKYKAADQEDVEQL